jgi:hypothetical protein
MNRKLPNLSLSLPRCGNCGLHWRPAPNVVSDTAYRKRCATERQTLAASGLGLKKITFADLSGAYLLPRKFRRG